MGEKRDLVVGEGGSEKGIRFQWIAASPDAGGIVGEFSRKLNGAKRQRAF